MGYKENLYEKAKLNENQFFFKLYQWLKTEKVWEEKFLKISSSKRLFYILKDQSQSESCTVMSDSATPWIIQPVEFSRLEYWSG